MILEFGREYLIFVVQYSQASLVKSKKMFADDLCWFFWSMDHCSCVSSPHLHDDAIEEFSSRAQLHDHVKAVLAVEYFIQLDDVRVVDSL